jgi:hypothetical protein
VARFVIDDSSICFINCHLAAGQNHVRQRNADVTGMLEERAVFSETDLPLAYVGGGDGSMVLDHELVFVSSRCKFRQSRLTSDLGQRGHELSDRP